MMFGDTTQTLTNDNSQKNTNVKDKTIDTKEQNNQTTTEHQNDNMLLPVPIPVKSKMLITLNTSLIISKPRFIKKFINSSKIRLAVVYTLSLAIMAFSFVQISRLYSQKKSSLEITTNLQSYITETKNENGKPIGSYSVDFNSLKKLNPDTVGWLRVNGIGFDLPIVQSQDNNYYLKHSFDKTYNVCGWAFTDYRNKLDGTDRNIVIFGHNRKDGSMFSNMTKILNPEWYDNEQNKYVSFITESDETKYEVFSIYQVEVEDYYLQTNFNSEEEYQKFLNILKSRSTKDYNISLTAKDKIITLSTCGKDNKHRIVLHARKI